MNQKQQSTEWTVQLRDVMDFESKSKCCWILSTFRKSEIRQIFRLIFTSDSTFLLESLSLFIAVRH